MYRGIIITYNPSIEDKKNIAKLVKHKYKLIIIDNGSSGIHGLQDITGFINSYNTTFIKLKKNYGLAYAQNRGIKEAENHKAEYIFLLDQDSELPENYFNDMISFYKGHSYDYKIGMVVPNFFDPNIRQYTRYAKLTRFFYKHISCENNEFCDVTFAVASGSLIPLKVIQDAGKMREELFIDYLDNEFSMRLHEKGYSTLVNCSVLMNHTIGKRSCHRFFGLTFKPNHHDASRKYYIFRNGFILIWEYLWRYPGFAALIANRMIGEILGIIFFEKDKISKFMSVFRGLKDSFFPVHFNA